jgi:hypothetical protein
VIYVFGQSVMQADGYARANNLIGARCYGGASMRVYGLLYTAQDEIYVLPAVPEEVLDRVRRDLAKRPKDNRPEIRFVPG